MPNTRGCCFNEFSMYVDPAQRQLDTRVLWVLAGVEGEGMTENKGAGNKGTAGKEKSAAEKHKEFGRRRSQNHSIVYVGKDLQVQLFPQH